MLLSQLAVFQELMLPLNYKWTSAITSSINGRADTASINRLSPFKLELNTYLKRELKNQTTLKIFWIVKFPKKALAALTQVLPMRANPLALSFLQSKIKTKATIFNIGSVLLQANINQTMQAPRAQDREVSLGQPPQVIVARINRVKNQGLKIALAHQRERIPL